MRSSPRRARRRSRLGPDAVTAVAGAGVAALLGLSWAGATAPVQDKPNTETDECLNDVCHAAIAQHAVMHRPTAEGECVACHEYDSPEEHLFALIAPPDELCWECHDVEFDEFAHAPTDEGRCMACHDAHGSPSPLMLVKGIGEGLCVTCHEHTLEEKEFLHGPYGAQECTACHHPHTSGHEALLLRPPRELCVDCHAEAVPAGSDAETGSHHEPVDQGCDACHDPHASDAEYQLVQTQPVLCFSCHEEVRDQTEEATLVHGPVTETGGCSSCHRPHFSGEPSLLVKTNADLCLECHTEPVETRRGRTLAAVRPHDMPRQHGPVRDGDCTACHEPHAGEQFRLLVEAYPSTFYAPFELERYELCFSCHPEDLVLEESGDEFTGFRDGERNLHWVHVNRNKGRTCRACHEVHASRQPFHIREDVPFGGWMIKMNYRRLDDGGTCAPGCHQQQEYRRSAAPLE